ncbi:MAG: HD domain-containing protein [Candidatus Eremiobacteraeota bacterium]|nr:HD domain-containing protein [Candidatus Eremiobacteraeota bacterium]
MNEITQNYRPHPLDARLAAALPAGALFAVGGRVRDELRTAGGVPPHDLDFVVAGVPLEAVRAALAGLGRVDLVGASFAVIKLTVDGQTVDVALPRRERSTGSGHRDFAVEAGPGVPLEDDLSRRDFRMNMIARALPEGRLVDPFWGAADIAAGRISILTPRTFDEDPLRLLRAAQFAARFAFLPTPETLVAMRAAASLVEAVSAERVAEELTKLLTLAARPSIGFELLRETGVLAHLWPELLEGVDVEQNEWHAYDVWRHNMASVDAVPPGDLIARASALLHDVGKPRTKDGPHFYRHEHVGADLARAMLVRFRFSNETVATVEHLVRQHMYSQDPELSDAAIRRFVRRIGPALLEHQFGLRRADIAGSGLPKRDDSNERFEARVREEVARKPAFSVADLAIGGADVIEEMVRRGLAEPGFTGDERVGATLRWLFEQVTDAPERNERSSLFALLQQHFGSV